MPLFRLLSKSIKEIEDQISSLTSKSNGAYFSIQQIMSEQATAAPKIAQERAVSSSSNSKRRPEFTEWQQVMKSYGVTEKQFGNGVLDVVDVIGNMNKALGVQQSVAGKLTVPQDVGADRCSPATLALVP